MKIAAVVVLFKPTEDVVGNIMSYAHGVDILMVWNNSPEIVLSIPIPENLDVRYMDVGKNMGLAYAYNQAIKIAENEECTHIMTMDQDSCFIHFDKYKKAIEDFGTDDMFTPPLKKCMSESIVEVSYAAQSGCVFSLTMIRKIGTFREDFFIGMVDTEMHLRAQENGYKLYLLPVCFMNHHVGSERTASIGKLNFAVSDYGPLRHYYDSRNRILMWKEFPYDYSWSGKLKHYIGRVKLCLKILLAEDRKFQKISAIIRGTWNGSFNRIVPF